MIVSLNEVESLAYKAARGAGASWGLAEEAAVAARWLAAHRLDWAPALADVLAKFDALSPPHDNLESMIAGRTQNAILCPLRTGAWMSDCWPNVIELRVTVRNVLAPILLLPFAAQLGSVVRLRSAGDLIEWQSGRVSLKKPLPITAQDIVLETSGGGPFAGLQSKPADLPPLTIDAASFGRLTALEARTYVPASDSSRLSGAGAGLADND